MLYRWTPVLLKDVRHEIAIEVHVMQTLRTVSMALISNIKWEGATITHWLHSAEFSWKFQTSFPQLSEPHRCSSITASHISGKACLLQLRLSRNCVHSPSSDVRSAIHAIRNSAAVSNWELYAYVPSVLCRRVLTHRAGTRVYPEANDARRAYNW